MSAAAAEGPYAGEHRPLTLLEQADQLMKQLPGHRVEILGGVLTVTPPPDPAHAKGLSRLRRPFVAAGLDGGETEVLEGLGLWLPDGPENFAVPDLCVVDADIEDHIIQYECCDPAAFRMVLEITSGNYTNDLRTKVTAYGSARVPVYVIVDRKHERLHVLTEPMEDGYAVHRIHVAGEKVTLPESIGAGVTLDVAQTLDDARRRTPQRP
ncbi:Uma2 family endonuclease [Streptomyces libani]|uniref:Membrane protein n=1 Tax=Streptomyces nigrescens TaxID=1920 RepID=A0A640TG25_STRNI|nr:MULTISPECIES: Uma2 family endonuclease [Streptomyces]WAT96928.1 Uma2 family endonuclease [Streptomyces libani subsp. libani]WDT57327.1 Uma2 family endonuclease [Streptomyces sp. G7(2002)]GFE22348.1 membrane protein [Streptomyces libani subsp. libani]GGV90672.1 membrane protein [Streptomyces libani subsp. libani]